MSPPNAMGMEAAHPTAANTGVDVVNAAAAKPDFDPSEAPPFKIANIRAAIPPHCWVKNPWRSLSYVLRDAVVILAFAAVALTLDLWALWPLYWVAERTMFWAVFVLGHDCGYGSFSDSYWLNNVVGHVLHCQTGTRHRLEREESRIRAPYL